MTVKALAFSSWGDEPAVAIQNSSGSILVSDSPADLLEFLRYSAKDCIRVCWDLDEFIAPILRTLPVPVLESLSRFEDDTQYAGHQIYYLPDRMFRVGRSRFYGIKQFWATTEPIPITIDEVQSKADELLYTLESCGMGNPDRLTSPISVFEQTDLGREVYASIPKGHDIPPSCFEALQYASYCDRREWISNYQIGHWSSGEIWDYDISSCYPSVASSLLNIRDFECWKASDIGSREQGAYYGFLHGHLFLDPQAKYAHCSPLMVDSLGHNKIPGNPVGDLGNDYYLTLDELRFISRYDLGTFHIQDGWFLKPLNGVRPNKPFQSIMDQLYQQRAKSSLSTSISKGIANQLIGKLIETKVNGEYGELRNDIYHALILSQSRLKVASFLIQNEITPSELVCVQTDGCRLTRLIPTPKSNGMGSWRCNGSRPTIVASPYRVYTDDKKPGHLTYDHIKELITAHPLSKWYGRTVQRRTTLKQALQQGNVSLVGGLCDLPAHLDMLALPREQSRSFPKLPNTGQSLLINKYQSSPIIL